MNRIAAVLWALGITAMAAGQSAPSAPPPGSAPSTSAPSAANIAAKLEAVVKDVQQLTSQAREQTELLAKWRPQRPKAPPDYDDLSDKEKQAYDQRLKVWTAQGQALVQQLETTVQKLDEATRRLDALTASLPAAQAADAQAVRKAAEDARKEAKDTQAASKPALPPAAKAPANPEKPRSLAPP